MKRSFVSLFVLICALLFAGMTSYADDGSVKSPIREGETELSIQIPKDIPKKPIKPEVYKPEIKPNVDRLLPKTNEMIQTLLFLLVGIAALIVFFGLFMFKKTIQNNNYILF